MRKLVFARIVILILLSLSALALAFAKTDEVISNSADWKDVYSSIIYANMIGASSHFLTSTPHGPLLLYEIPKTLEGIEIITSAAKPYVIGYESLMQSKGYENVQEFIYNEANLELAKKLPPEINSFIVLDGNYGYNALAVAPYASKTKHYVLFANRRNIEDIAAFLATRNVKNIIVYGQVDREVRSALTIYSPEIMNSETGSRFENNMMIVDKFAEVASIKQVILTNGEFMEASMMAGTEPVLFIGKNNVPSEISSYIKEKGIEIGVLIGNELIGTATDIRRQLGISVFVKFARGSRIPGGTINPVEDLDRFPMPSYQLSMSIVSISYNKATGLLEVTYKNNVDLASYFRSTITIRNAAGETLAVVGDNNAIFIDGQETKTIVYKLDISSQDIDNLSGEVYVIYGESKTSLENVIRGTFKIEVIDVLDNTDIEIIDLVYDKAKGRFYVTIENTGTADVYVAVELVDLWINGEYVTVSSDEIVKIEPGQKKKIPVIITLEDEDIESPKNSEITVNGMYGERMHALVNTKTAKFKFRFKESGIWYYAIILIIIILLLFFLIARRRKRCPRCRTMNKRSASNCKKCGYEFNKTTS